MLWIVYSTWRGVAWLRAASRNYEIENPVAIWLHAPATRCDIQDDNFVIPIFGLHGAVLATAIGNATIVVWVFALNHRYGCKTDVGIWLCAALPLILLTGQVVAGLSVLVIALICVTTNLILNADEKTSIREAFGNLPDKYFSAFR